MGQEEINSFDSYGRLQDHTDFKGQQDVYHYDSLGRNDTQTFYAAGSQTAGETMTFSFDNLDRPYQIVDNIVGVTTRTTTFGYDLDNNVTSIATPEGTVNYVFDPATDRHTETYTATSDILYGYDILSRLETVTVKEQNGTVLNPQLTTTYYYTAVGNIDHVTFGKHRSVNSRRERQRVRCRPGVSRTAR
jgi:hypothetical protein